MKKALSLLLIIAMMISLFPLCVSAIPEEADTGKGGITFSGSAYGADEDYRLDANLKEVPHTLSAWVYLDDDAYSKRNIVFGNYPSNTRYTGYLNLEINASNHPRFTHADTDQTMFDYVFTDVTVEKNTWTQVAVTFDEDAKAAYCYINGTLAQTITDGFTPIDPTVINYPFILGGDHRRDDRKFNQHYFKGELKDFYVYADARTAAEVASDYQNGPALNNVDLILAYDIDEDDQGKNLADESGNGYTAYYNKWWLTEAEMAALRGDTSDRAYSFAVVPDIQYMTEWHQEQLPVLYQWIADNAESKNIQLVMGLGDISNTDTNYDEESSEFGRLEWQTTYEAISLLNGVVPYTLVRGNHDVYNKSQFSDSAPENLVGLKGQGFIQYFGGESFYAQQFKNPDGYEAGYYEGTLANYQGVEETDEVANAWRTLEADGDKWLIMALDWGVHNDVIEWASDVIEAHPNHRVIITTHNYMNVSGDHTDNRLSGDVTSGSLQKGFNNGDGIWDKLVSRHSNIELVLCGHISSSTIVVEQNEGVYGNTVTQMLIDGQNIDRYWYNPDAGKVTAAGLVALLYVSKDGTSVDVEYYSTVTGKYLSSMSQRTVDLNAECDAPDTGWDGVSQFAPLGSGTKDDPYQITCAENLMWMAKKCAYASSPKINPFQGCYFKQMCDIDLNGQKLTQIGSYLKLSDGSVVNYATFGGVYDGQGYRIHNGYISDHSSASQNENWGVGIFGYVYSSDGTASIKNLVADNITASGITAVGIIAGKTYNATIINCTVTDTCKVIGTGTKIGVSTSTSVINNKYAQWNIYTQNRLGGIVGHAATGGHVYCCVSNATVYTNGNNAFAGGIVGSISASPNIRYNEFHGKIINDFTDESYCRDIEGENVNGGIIGYMGSGSYTLTGSRYHTHNINNGNFEIIGTATTDVVYGGLIGASKELSGSGHYIQSSVNLSDDIKLGSQTVTVYVGGLIGRATQNAGATAKAAALKKCYSVPLPGITNGGLNVDTTVYTTDATDDLYNKSIVSSGTQAVTTDTVGTKALSEMTSTITSIRDTIASERTNRAGVYRDTDTLRVLAYQTAIPEDDYRVRLVFGVDNPDLFCYGFEMTLTYTENGQTYRKTASLSGTIVYTDIIGTVDGEEVIYNAQSRYGCPYFATLVINPVLAGKVIAGEAVCTITAYTVSDDGIRHSYGGETVSLTFTDGVLTKPEANIYQ